MTDLKTIEIENDLIYEREFFWSYLAATGSLSAAFEPWFSCSEITNKSVELTLGTTHLEFKYEQSEDGV